jgi:hypothetical protein
MTTSPDNEKAAASGEAREEPVEEYQRPEIIDYGTLSELTLSGLGPQTDSLLGGAGS